LNWKKKTSLATKRRANRFQPTPLVITTDVIIKKRPEAQPLRGLSIK